MSSLKIHSFTSIIQLSQDIVVAVKALKNDISHSFKMHILL